MSDLETAARPYSKAIYELASEQKNLPFWSDVLQLASQVATEDEMQVLITLFKLIIGLLVLVIMQYISIDLMFIKNF